MAATTILLRLAGEAVYGRDEDASARRECQNASMTKFFRQTVERVAKLPDRDQDAAAGAILDYLDHQRGLALTDEQAAEVRRRLAAPRNGVPLGEVRDRFRRL